MFFSCVCPWSFPVRSFKSNVKHLTHNSISIFTLYYNILSVFLQANCFFVCPAPAKSAPCEIYSQGAPFSLYLRHDRSAEPPTDRRITRDPHYGQSPGPRPEPPYGRSPRPPSRVMVSPVMNLKSGEANCTHTRPISSSASPRCPMGGMCTFFS